MKRLYTYTILYFVLIFSGEGQVLFAQVDTLPVRISGIITALDSTDATPYVHVVNKRTGSGVISDSIGIFSTKVRRGDTLEFKCLGFTDFVFTLPDTSSSNVYLLAVEMSSTSYEIDVIDVFGLNRKSQVRHDIIHMGPDPSAQERQLYIPGVFIGDYQNVLPHDIPILVAGGGVFTSMYYKWAKRGKSLVKLNQLLTEDLVAAEIEAKYNRELLCIFTKYHPSKLDCFTMFLNFSNDFLYKESDYQIFYVVKQRMIPFEQKYQEDSVAMLKRFVE